MSGFSRLTSRRRSLRFSSLGDSLILVVMMAFVLIVLVFQFGGFTGRMASEDKAVKALTDQGFSNVRITDRHVFFVQMRGCSKSDSARFDAVATNPVGKKVDMAVCTGWPVRGATVRTP